MKFLGVTILPGVKFPIFLLIFAWATVQRDCAACDYELSIGTKIGDLE